MEAKSKFIPLFENTLSRYTNGGFSGGDLVKFKSDALKHEFFKSQPQNYIDHIKDLIGSGLNLRVTNVKPALPVAWSGINSDNQGTDFYLEIAQELMPGKVVKHTTIPACCVEPVSTYINLPPVPKIMEYDSKIQLKPRFVKQEDNEKVEFYRPNPQTNTSDLGGGKMSTGDRELLNKNIKIPTKTAEGQKDPATYTAKYLPKEK